MAATRGLLRVSVDQASAGFSVTGGWQIGCRCGFAGMRIFFVEPGAQQGVAHRQQQRTQEDADQAEADQSADDPGKDQQQWQVGPAPDQPGAQEIVQIHHDQHPHQQGACPCGLVAPVQPDHRWQQHRQDADLRDAQHEHQCRQDGGEGDAGEQQADATQQGLHQCGDADPEGHATDCACRQRHHLFAALPAEFACEAAQGLCGDFALHVQDRRDGDGQSDLQHDHAQTAYACGEPFCHVASVGRGLGGQPLHAQRGTLRPEFACLAAHVGQRGEPGGGFRCGQAFQGACQGNDLAAVVDQRADRQHEGQEQEQPQTADQARDGQPASSAQTLFQYQHQWPGGHHDHRCPGDGHQEGRKHPQ